MVPHDPPVGQDKRYVAVPEMLEGSQVQPVRMMYRDLDGKMHERIMGVPFDAACEIAKDYAKRGMTEVMVWRPLDPEKVRG
jgi:hypothetical protein